jgi:hypothetical protein
MKYPEILDFTDFDSWKQKYLSKEIMSKEWDLMTQEILPDVIEIPFFTEEFCDKFVENLKEVKYHQSDRWGTPTDVVSLETLGLKDIMLDIFLEFLHPITYHYWMVDGKKWKYMDIDPQVLRFKPNQDLRLHHDYCSISMTVLLDGNSKGGELLFEKYGIVKPVQGSIYIFPGQITHRYGMRNVKNHNRYLLNIYSYAE